MPRARRRRRCSTGLSSTRPRPAWWRYRSGRAGSAGRGRTFRTDRRGWYLRQDHSIAVDVNARYLVLTVPTSWSALFTGATVAESAPPLVVGRGGKDGDAVDLAALLARRLTAGNDASR